MTPQAQAFLDLAARAAVRSQAATGVPAELTLPQAIFESAWGAHAPGNNCLGIKANGRGSGTQNIPTREFVKGQWITVPLAFEVYPSIEACFEDHGWLLANGAPYAAAWRQFKADSNTAAFILAIGKVYATAPNYGQTILAFSESPTITAALMKAREGG